MVVLVLVYSKEYLEILDCSGKYKDSSEPGEDNRKAAEIPKILKRKWYMRSVQKN